MPTKPRAPRGHRYTFKGMKLTKDQRAQMAGLAGLTHHGPKADALVADVEKDLSDAVDFRDSVERGPSPAGRAALLLEVERAAEALVRALRDLDQGSWSWLRDAIAEDPSFPDPDQSCLLKDDDERPNLDELESLARCARSERKDRWLKAGKKGRGAEEARDELIAALAQRYHHHAEPRRDRKSKVVEFVTAGLTAGGFYAPAGDKLLRMIDEEWRMPKKRP